MRRFSFQTTAVLALPCLVVPLAAWLLSPLFRAKNEIEVLVAARRAPTAAAASEGATVGATIKLNEWPDDNSGVTWTNSYRVDAGEHALWNWKDGNVERDISKASSRFDGAWNEWKGDFDLRMVPKEWGDVVLSFEARLVHVRARSLSLTAPPTQFVRRGKIILRRAGETVGAGAQVDHNPHLRPLDWDLSLIKRPQSGVVYRLIVFRQRDRELDPNSPEDFRALFQLKGISRDAGRSAQQRTLQVQGTSSDSRRFASEKAEKANRISTFTLYYDALNRPLSAHIEGRISFHNGWPLRVSIPFSDEKGRVLVHTSRTKTP